MFETIWSSSGVQQSQNMLEIKKIKIGIYLYMYIYLFGQAVLNTP